MPRSGAYTVSDLPSDRLCRIACGRSGAYRPDSLLKRYGDMALPDVMIAVTACERRGDYSRPCGAGYVNPPGSVIADIDVWRVAARLVKRHGKDAALVESQRIDEFLAEGDLEGRAVWYRILEAAKELERTKPAEGERVN